MNLYNNYFNKEHINDIQYEDLVNFFAESRVENDKVELKSYFSLNDNKSKEGIFKSICGFLNSDGGILILGAPKGKKIADRKEKEFCGELALIDVLYEKDAFISRATDSITPAPKGILFHRIEKEKKFAYIIDVPKSEYSPHQFQDTYYMRIDGQTKPAPHHYIEALMKKITFPNLMGFLKIEQINLVGTNIILIVSIYIYNLSKLQNDYNVNYRLLGISGKKSHTTYVKGGWEHSYNNTNTIIHYGEPFYDEIAIEFNPYELQKNNYETVIEMYFGAKYSPMKTCHYKIRLEPYYKSNIQNCIIEKRENQFMYEIKESMGITDKEAIEKMLERPI